MSATAKHRTGSECQGTRPDRGRQAAHRPGGKRQSRPRNPTNQQVADHHKTQGSRHWRPGLPECPCGRQATKDEGCAEQTRHASNYARRQGTGKRSGSQADQAPRRRNSEIVSAYFRIWQKGEPPKLTCDTSPISNGTVLIGSASVTWVSAGSGGDPESATAGRES